MIEAPNENPTLSTSDWIWLALSIVAFVAMMIWL